MTSPSPGYQPGLMDLAAYGLLIGVTAKILLVENKDVTCPNFHASKEECEIRGGMPFSDTQPEPNDTPKVLKAKVGKALKHWSTAVKWRRSLVLAVAITGTMTVLLYRKVIPWQQFYLGVLVSYAIIFAYHNYYDFHVAGPAEKRGHASLEAMYEKMKRLRTYDR